MSANTTARAPLHSLSDEAELLDNNNNEDDDDDDDDDESPLLLPPQLVASAIPENAKAHIVRKSHTPS